jgi:hypothetical protein
MPFGDHCTGPELHLHHPLLNVVSILGRENVDPFFELHFVS